MATGDKEREFIHKYKDVMEIMRNDAIERGINFYTMGYIRVGNNVDENMTFLVAELHTGMTPFDRAAIRENMEDVFTSNNNDE